MRRAFLITCITALCVALITTLFLAFPANAELNTTKTINFQGRLLTAEGTVVPDGFYNIQFKIYQDGTGTATGNPGGTLEWTENHINNGGSNGVEVKNGFLSVNLGSINPFGTSVDWNQDTLWLSMNVAGSAIGCSTFGSGPCAADGEMLPMKRLTATPYAINSGALSGKTAENFVQLAQGVQTDNSNLSSIFINKTGSGNLMQLQNSSTDVFTIANAGDVIFGSNSDKSISLADSATGTDGRQLSISAGNGGTGLGNDGGTLVLQGGSAGGVDANGGNVIIKGGSGAGTGVDGLVVLGATTFSSSNDTNCYTGGATVASSCTLTSSSINNTSAIMVGFNTAGQTVTVPDPVIVTAGRVAYIVASSDSENFTVSINGGAKTIAMQANTTAQLVWNGSDWTVTGAQSGTALEYTPESPSVQVGNPSDNEPTLLTLGKSDTAPEITDQSLLGSMYYDTTLGVVQCFEAAGWGDCGDKPDTFVSLIPEYSNAVTNGPGIGQLTSDFCSDTLEINNGSSGQPEICGTNETYNFYQWSSTELVSQTRSIYVTYQLPSNFKEFIASSTSLKARTDSANASVTYQLYRNDGNGLTACGTQVAASTGIQTAWQTSAADPSLCNFEAGDSLIIKINMTAQDEANAYVSNLNFAYKNK